MTDDQKRIAADIDEDTHAILKEKLEYGELSEVIRDVANTIAFGDGWDRRTVIDRRIEQKRQELSTLRDQRREINGKIESIEDRIDELEDRRERVETEAEQYTGALWSLEQSFRAGELGHLDPEHGRVKSLANEFGKSPESVLDELRERNPDVPDYAFKQKMHASRQFDGLPEDRVKTPVEQREEVSRR